MEFPLSNTVYHQDTAACLWQILWMWVTKWEFCLIPLALLSSFWGVAQCIILLGNPPSPGGAGAMGGGYAWSSYVFGADGLCRLTVNARMKVSTAELRTIARWSMTFTFPVSGHNVMADGCISWVWTHIDIKSNLTEAEAYNCTALSQVSMCFQLWHELFSSRILHANWTILLLVPRVLFLSLLL